MRLERIRPSVLTAMTWMFPSARAIFSCCSCLRPRFVAMGCSPQYVKPR